MDDKRCPPTAVPGQSLPWFIYTHGDARSKNVQTFSTSAFNGKSYLKSVPAMRGKFIQAAALGWLLLRDERYENRDHYSFTLWNPFTLKSIHLPTLVFHDEGTGRMRCALTSLPPSDEDEVDDKDSKKRDCFVFLFFEGWAFSCLVRDTDTGSSGCGWVSRAIEVEGEAAAIHQLATLNGAVYVTACILRHHSRVEYLVCIEVANDGSNSFTLRFLPHISIPRILLPSQFMLDQSFTFTVESCGNIYTIQVGTRHYDGVHSVKVLELDLETGIWGEVKCLGDRAFLLAEDGCTWCSASMASDDDDSTTTSGTVQGNCVYFYRPELVQEAVVCYRLSDCSSTFLPCPKLLNPRSYWPVWVAPQHNMTLTGDRFSVIKQGRQCEKGFDDGKPSKDDDNMSGNNKMDKLPLHIIELISKYMHLFDYWMFRRTCKSIHSGTYVPQWRTNNSLPLFLVFEGDGALCRVMDPCRDDSHTFILQFCQNFFDIRFSKNGWLLITEGLSLQFISPFTRERGNYPPAKRHFMSIGFSSYPTCSSCVTVTISYHRGQFFIDYLRFGDEEWNSIQFDNNQGNPFNPGFCNPTYYAGGFYFLDEVTGNLGVFELIDGDTRWTIYERPDVRAGRFHSNYLVECGGDLISVFIGKNGSWVQVFKFNNTNKKWVRIKDLGNHILFISYVSCYSVVTRESNMKNRIYLPWLKRKRNVFYSLKTGKYHVDDSDDYCKDFFFMNQPFRCCWI